MTPQTPSVNCTWCAFAIHPSLPTGLTFDTSSGALSGEPENAFSLSEFTIYANASNGTYSSSIYIQIILDTDGDGISDDIDEDDDNDSVPDSQDSCDEEPGWILNSSNDHDSDGCLDAQALVLEDLHQGDNIVVQHTITDSQNRVYVAGYYYSNITLGQTTLNLPDTSHGGAFMARMAADGTWDWLLGINGTNTPPYVTDIDVDNHGNLYAVGSFHDHDSSSPDISWGGIGLNGLNHQADSAYIIMANSNGTEGWIRVLAEQHADFKIDAVSIEDGSDGSLAGITIAGSIGTQSSSGWARILDVRSNDWCYYNDGNRIWGYTLSLNETGVCDGLTPHGSGGSGSWQIKPFKMIYGGDSHSQRLLRISDLQVHNGETYVSGIFAGELSIGNSWNGASFANLHSSGADGDYSIQSFVTKMGHWAEVVLASTEHQGNNETHVEAMEIVATKIFITGHIDRPISSTGDDLLLAAFDRQNGTRSWIEVLGTAAHENGVRSHDLHVNSDGSVTIVGTFEGTLSSGTTCYCLDFGLHNISSQFQSGFISNYNPNSGWTSAHHIGGRRWMGTQAAVRYIHWESLRGY